MDVFRYLYLIFLWICLLLILLFKGGKGLESIVGLEYCGTGYWLAQMIAFIWLFAFSGVMARRAVSKSRRKLMVNFAFEEGDVIWDSWRKVRYLKKFVVKILLGHHLFV